MNIAIIIPIYRHTYHLERVLNSVLWQLESGDRVQLICEREEYQAIEAVLQSLHVPREKNVYLHARMTGDANCASARNFGIDSVESADWIKFLDADDVLAPFALAAFRAERIPDTVQCVAGRQVKVVDGRIAGWGIPNWKVIEHANPTVPSMTFVRMSAFETVGGFDPRISFEEDWDLWLKLRKAYGMQGFAAVQWPVCYYWISQAERAAKNPSHQVEGMDVREYFGKTYGITPYR